MTNNKVVNPNKESLSLQRKTETADRQENCRHGAEINVIREVLKGIDNDKEKIQTRTGSVCCKPAISEGHKQTTKKCR